MQASSPDAAVLKPSINLCDLPYELKELIAFKCDYFTYERLRACDSVFYSMPASKTVDFEEYRSVLSKLKAEKWQFGSDFEEYKKGFWNFSTKRAFGISLEARQSSRTKVQSL